MSWLFGLGKSSAGPTAAAQVAEVQEEKSADIKEKQREWQATLRQKQRDLDRSVREIERSEEKVKLAIKKAAKDGQMQGAKELARQIVMSTKAKDRLSICKTHLEMISVQLKTAAATLKMTGSMARSAEIMASVNALCKASETQAVSRELAQELARFGIIDEMMSEQLDSALDPDGNLEELADDEVELIVQEIVVGVKSTAKAGTFSPQICHCFLTLIIVFRQQGCPQGADS